MKFFYIRWFIALLALACLGFAFGWVLTCPGWLVIVLGVLGAILILLPLSRHGQANDEHNTVLPYLEDRE